MTSLTESDEFKDLHTLMHQLSICGTDSTVHVDCVLCLNNITENCTEIGNLLEKCFKLNGIDKKPEQKLTNCLTRLTNVVFEALIEFSKKSDRFEELRLWTVILKVLAGSFALHSNMWINASSPEKVSTYFKSTLAKRGKDDLLYKKFMESAELSKFLEIETGSEAYLTKLKKMFLDFCDPKYNNYSLDVEELEKNIPAEFKFSKDLFEELLGVEGSILNREQSDESLKAFYKLLFFVFEHSADKAQFCQMYADQDRYTDEQQKLRDAATRDLLFGSMAKFIGMAVTLENTQLFHWLYVMNPKFPFLANSDLYTPLPVLPSERVETSQQSSIEGNEQMTNEEYDEGEVSRGFLPGRAESTQQSGSEGSDQQMASDEETDEESSYVARVQSCNGKKSVIKSEKVTLRSIGCIEKSAVSDAKLELPEQIVKGSEMLSNVNFELFERLEVNAAFRNSATGPNFGNSGGGDQERPSGVFTGFNDVPMPSDAFSGFASNPMTTTMCNNSNRRDNGHNQYSNGNRRDSDQNQRNSGNRRDLGYNQRNSGNRRDLGYNQRNSGNRRDLGYNQSNSGGRQDFGNQRNQGRGSHGGYSQNRNQGQSVGGYPQNRNQGQAVAETTPSPNYGRTGETTPGRGQGQAFDGYQQNRNQGQAADVNTTWRSGKQSGRGDADKSYRGRSPRQ